MGQDRQTQALLGWSALPDRKERSGGPRSHEWVWNQFTWRNVTLDVIIHAKTLSISLNESVTVATHELWVQENIYKPPEQIFKAALGALRVQHPPWST